MRRLYAFILSLLLSSVVFAQKMKEVELPAGPVAGFDVEWAGHTGNHTKYSLDDDGDGKPDWDGIRFVGMGQGITHVVPQTSDDSTIFVGPYAGTAEDQRPIRLEFFDLTIHGGPRKALHQGIENRPMNGQPYVPCTIAFVRCSIEADEPGEYPWTPAAGGLGNTSVWGIFGYNCSFQLENCLIDWTRGAEHALYDHGMAQPGIIFSHVIVVGSGGEILKVATRPGEAFYVPNVYVLVDGCSFQNWGPQPWSWRGGGGIVLQGSGANLIVRDSEFLGGPGAAKSRTIMLDDGGSGRYYNTLTGEVGTGPANGWVLLERVLLVGDGLPSWAILARAGANSGTYAGQTVCRAYGMLNCGVYSLSETSKVELAGIQGNSLAVVGCNTPQIKALVQERLGPMARLNDAKVAMRTVPSFDIPSGFMGGIFAPAPQPAETTK